MANVLNLQADTVEVTQEAKVSLLSRHHWICWR